jgi:hypothetical protein
MTKPLQRRKDHWQKADASRRAIEYMRAALVRIAADAPLQPGDKGYPRMRGEGPYTAPDRRLMRLSGKQNHRCCYCGCETTFNGFQPNTVRTEYVIPLVFGGADHELNSVMACASCPSQPRDDYAQLVEYAAGGVDEYLHEQLLLSHG